MDHRCNPPQIPAMISSEMTPAMLEAFKLMKELGESIHSFHRRENKKLVTNKICDATDKIHESCSGMRHS